MQRPARLLLRPLTAPITLCRGVDVRMAQHWLYRNEIDGGMQHVSGGESPEIMPYRNPSLRMTS